MGKESYTRGGSEHSDVVDAEFRVVEPEISAPEKAEKSFEQTESPTAGRSLEYSVSISAKDWEGYINEVKSDMAKLKDQEDSPEYRALAVKLGRMEDELRAATKKERVAEAGKLKEVMAEERATYGEIDKEFWSYKDGDKRPVEMEIKYEAARKKYNAAKEAYRAKAAEGERERLDERKRELERHGLPAKDIEREMAIARSETMLQIIGGEKEMLIAEKADLLSAKKLAWYKEALDWYANLPPVLRMGITTGIVGGTMFAASGVIAALTGAAVVRPGVSLGTYLAGRMLRAMTASSVGSFAGQIPFKVARKRSQRDLEKVSREKQGLLENSDHLLSVHWSINNAAAELLKRDERRKRIASLASAGGAVVTAVATSIGLEAMGNSNLGKKLPFFKRLFGIK